MLKNLRFYYHFFIIIVTKKYKQFLLYFFLIVLVLAIGKIFILNLAPGIFKDLLDSARKPRYYEGVVGSVQTLNPVYESTLAEQEIDSLVFRGLTKISETGEMEPDLAESFTRLSNTKYRFKLKENSKWHDGAKITSDDVVYTVNLTQKTLPVSKLAANFKDVKVVKIDDYTFDFELTDPFSPFLVNTTIGIVPSHISLEKYRPVGSGEFEVKKISEKEILLESSSAELIFRLYKNKNDAILALKLGEIDSIGGLSFFDIQELRFWPNVSFYSSDLATREVILFFNLKDKLLAEKKIRQLLSESVPKQLVSQVLPGISQEISFSSLPLISSNKYLQEQSFKFEPQTAEKSLIDLGWKKENAVLVKNGDRLKINLTTGSDGELFKIAQIIEQAWEVLGVEVEIRIIDATELRDKTIPERNFQALLIVQQLSTDPDQYSLWHSTQTNNANISSLSSDRIDKIVEDGRRTFDQEKRKEIYELFNRLLSDEAPAVFLYYPKYFWVVDNDIKNVSLPPLIKTSDRFKNIKAWKKIGFSNLN